jgi:predicted DNA-binding ribbon-helix-helix protein
MQHRRKGENSEETEKIYETRRIGVTNLTSQIRISHQFRNLSSILKKCIKIYNPHQAANIASILKLMHNGGMRTTISLDDETHEFAAYYARSRGLTLSAAIDELIRKAQEGPKPKPDIWIGPNGLPMFPPTGRRITAEMVKKIEEEEFDPKNFT